MNLLLLLVLTFSSRRPMRKMRRCLWVTMVLFWLLMTLSVVAVVSMSRVAELVLFEITSMMGFCDLGFGWLSGCLKDRLRVHSSSMSGKCVYFTCRVWWCLCGSLRQAAQPMIVRGCLCMLL